VNAPDGRPMIEPGHRQVLRTWLAENHSLANGVWLANHKKGTVKPRLEYDEIVEELLCFGWIDSKSNHLDDERSLLWISPRKPRSGWSRTNKERVERLEREGLMTDAGRAAIAEAKRNGAWTALDAVERLEIPDDLAAALAADADAARHFDAFPPSSKKIILTWITSAKRAETRERRVSETVELAAKNIRANHYPQ
jgi:uncharacterized protein YdeI (YjbR/CyaY-like superfamily)